MNYFKVLQALFCNKVISDFYVDVFEDDGMDKNGKYEYIIKIVAHNKYLDDRSIRRLS